jgi:cellulose synthase/poly-beta-1,6-N-acetylglucosamine synthase-like glycosyltransferase
VARHQQERRVGDHLVDRGLVGKATLDAAQRVAAESGARIGDVLIAIGALDSVQLTRALADLWGLPYASPTRSADAPDVPGLDVGDLLAEGWLPLERRGDGVPVVAVTDEPTPDLRARIAAALGEEPFLVLADRGELQQAVLERYGTDLRDRASLGLWGRSPDQSARTVLVPWQRVALVVALVLVLLAAVADLRLVVVTLSVLVGFAFLVGTGFKFWASLRGARMEHVTRTDPARLAALPDHELPRYTVLVPVYKEANIVANLIGNLGALDYPAHLLEVLILVEEDDTETRAAAEAAHPPAHFRFITVPAGAPQTKPKACNVEDKPEPDQLKKAVLAFRDAGEDLVCVQAALNYFNAEENALTRMFTLEYSFWFDYMLPGLEYNRLAIPLGGTSNHFRVSGLRRLGGWDPYNVTEDADLGIRASAEGMRVGVIDSTTYEEANTSYPNFVRQRSRWIKGYMQTTLVHLRHPFRLVRVAGLRQTLSFLFLVGGTPATFLAVPLLYAVFLASLLLEPEQLSFLFPGWVLWLSLFNLGVGSALMIYVSMMGAFKRRRYGLVLWGIANPAYWLLHSVAAYKALWQLVTKPHYWEKTAHGLTGLAAAPHPVPAGRA